LTVVTDLYRRASSSALAQRFSRSPHAAKVTKYAIGSVIALLTSIIVFAVAYVILGGHPTTCSILAFFAGAIPNWILNRRWAWKMKGRADFLREIVAYIAISGVVLVASSVATTAMQHWVLQHVPAHHGLRAFLVTGAYVLVQAVMFVLKFVVYEKWVFSGQSRLRAAVRSRHQVWSAARANRTP
jgi:putative flippase GtrA